MRRCELSRNRSFYARKIGKKKERWEKERREEEEDRAGKIRKETLLPSCQIASNKDRYEMTCT